MAEPLQGKKDSKKNRHIPKHDDTHSHYKESTESKTAQPPPHRIFYVSLLIFLVALSIRLLYLYESSDNPTFDAPIVDAQGYDQLGRGLAEKHLMSQEFFWRGFFYPFFLAGVYAVSGSSILFAKILQAALGSFTCVLVYQIGRRAFGHLAGVFAGVIAAFYGPLIFYDGELLSTGWETFWSAVLVLLFLKAVKVKRQLFYFALGLCGGLSAVTRVTFLPFLLAGGIWLVVVWRRDNSQRRFIAGALLSVLTGLLAVTLPVAIQNYRVTGVFSIQPSNGSLNLYLGNNPDVCTTLTARPGPDYSAILNLPKKYGIEDIRGQEKFFYDKVFSYALAQPVGFFKGLAYKALQFVNSREIPNTYKIYLYRQWSFILSLLLWKIGPFGFPFGVVLPLAAIGLIFCRNRQAILILLFLLIYSLSIILVHVNDRYRMPVVPAMCVLAGAGCLAIIRTIHSKKYHHLAFIILSTTAITALSTVGGPFCLEKLNYEAELYYGVANYRQMQGRNNDAITNYLKALQLNSDSSETHNNLAATFLGLGQTDKAVAHYKEAVGLRPNWAKGHENLADALLQQKNIFEACEEYEKAIQLDPNLANAHKNLGDLLMHQGRSSEAVEHYRRAFRIKGDSPALLNNLAWILATSGNETIRNADEAVILAERACKLVDYKNASMLDTLATAYAAAGRFPEAVATGQKALTLAVSSGEKEVAENIRSNLELYKANRAIYLGPR
jgi:tetratricopeptide (TPR) repeat protein/4-amino-4-deoxy-L-arabinose transferase-like glycosyltransferase